VKYFFDNSISYRYANMLKALDVDVVALRELFSQSIKDPDLFRKLHGSDVVYVAADRKQTTRIAEARALKDAGITALFMGPFWDRMVLWQQATWLISRWPIIDGFAAGVAKGTCAELRQSGKAMVFTL
jgi:PIN like domain